MLLELFLTRASIDIKFQHFDGLNPFNIKGGKRLKNFMKNFMKGILTIVPILIVGYVCYNTFMFLDGLLGNVLRLYLKEMYVPGIGIILTVFLITLFGWLSTKVITGAVYNKLDKWLENIPLIKTVYSVSKDLIQSFVGEKKSFSTVVLITHANSEMKSIGFLTVDNLEQLHKPLVDYVAVYIPQTLQVAGFTFLVPKRNIEIIDISPEQAMKFVISGGMTGK